MTKPRAAGFPRTRSSASGENRIDLTRSLKDIHFKCSRRDESYLNRNQDKVRSITLRKDCCGSYFLSVLIDRPNEKRPIPDKCVGVDLGIKDFVVTSDGDVFENQHFRKKETDRIKRLQRQLSRKQKGSKNRERARIRLAKKHRKIDNRKQNYLHQVSNRLINENQVVCMEDLNVKGMMRRHTLAESIQEVNLGEFRRIVEYKAEWYGRKLSFVDRFYPSSKTCHCCGFVRKDLKLSERSWVCPQCGASVDRDLNAAMNILDEGLRIIGLSSPESTLADCPTVDDKASSMPLKSSGRLKQEKKCVSLTFNKARNYFRMFPTVVDSVIGRWLLSLYMLPAGIVHSLSLYSVPSGLIQNSPFSLRIFAASPLFPSDIKSQSIVNFFPSNSTDSSGLIQKYPSFVRTNAAHSPFLINWKSFIQ